MAKIKLDDGLYDRIKAVSDAVGYSSPDEFIVHVIEKELSVIESADTDSDVTERLKGLGYLE
jgi:predicted DNA-binding protein